MKVVCLIAILSHPSHQTLIQVPIYDISYPLPLLLVVDAYTTQFDNRSNIILLLAANRNQRTIQPIPQTHPQQQQLLHLIQIKLHQQHLQNILLSLLLVYFYHPVQILLTHVSYPQIISIALLYISAQLTNKNVLKLVLSQDFLDLIEKNVTVLTPQKEVYQAIYYTC